MLKVKIEGDYYTHSKTMEFFTLEGVIPDVPVKDEEGGVHEGMVLSHMQNRYFWLWSKDAGLKGVSTLRTCSISSISEVNGKPSFVGKNIKDMSWVELQDLAVAHNLLEVPHPQVYSLKEAREKAYQVYSRDILGREIDPRDPGYSYLKLPDLFVDDDGRIAETAHKKDNEEILNEEGANRNVNQKGKTTDGGKKKRITFAELKKVAKDRNIEYNDSEGYDILYKKVFS